MILSGQDIENYKEDNYNDNGAPVVFIVSFYITGTATPFAFFLLLSGALFFILCHRLNTFTCTLSPCAIPWAYSGMTTIPSALTSEVITPAPLESGAATTRSPTLPTDTLRRWCHHLASCWYMASQFDQDIL